MDCFLITAPIFLLSLCTAVYVGKRSVRRNLENYVEEHLSRFDEDASTYNKGTADALKCLRTSLKTRKLVWDWQSKGEI